MIEEEKVAFLLTWNTNMNNFVFLGDVDETAYRGTLTIQNTIDRFDSWWTLSLNQVYYGNQSVKTSTVKYAVLDTSQAMIYLSRTDYENFRNEIRKSDKVK